MGRGSEKRKVKMPLVRSCGFALPMNYGICKQGNTTKIDAFARMWIVWIRVPVGQCRQLHKRSQ
eukprot:scaffold34682_cov243-Amphora_coffeaeformis.AAC.2